jgi:hypothetical protein
MKTLQICPSCHGETQRMAYCAIRQCLVCAESCALTEREVFLLNLSVLPHPLTTTVSAVEPIDETLICKIERDKW